MGPVVLGNEEKMGNGSRVESGQDRGLARITDGSRRKPEEEVGVMRGRFLQILSPQISVETPDPIDHRRVALKGDLLFQPVMENARDQGLLLSKGGFFFDDGGEDKRFSLFNTTVWGPIIKAREIAGLPIPLGLGVVPVMYEGKFLTREVEDQIFRLRTFGSLCAPGFMDPEGVVVYHDAAKAFFKVTVKDDEKPKGSTERG